jgi:CheY-like chemotaxis protein
MLPLRRVLLADDDLEVRRGVEELLMPLGAKLRGQFGGLEFLHADSGFEALRIARERLDQLHLMVLDMHMPGCTGLDVLTSLCGETSLRGELALRGPSGALRIPCIFYSGEATPGIEQRALEAGAWAFLRKPVQPEQLRGEVLRALQQVRPA